MVSIGGIYTYSVCVCVKINFLENICDKSAGSFGFKKQNQQARFLDLRSLTLLKIFLQTNIFQVKSRLINSPLLRLIRSVRYNTVFSKLVITKLTVFNLFVECSLHTAIKIYTINSASDSFFYLIILKS